MCNSSSVLAEVALCCWYVLKECSGFLLHEFWLLRNTVLIMIQRDATGCSLFYFTAKNTLHVSGVADTWPSSNLATLECGSRTDTMTRTGGCDVLCIHDDGCC
jgi:hypothetical protein